jgi:hypothetical protein
VQYFALVGPDGGTATAEVPHGYDDTARIDVQNLGTEPSSPDATVVFTLTSGFDLGPAGIREGDGDGITGHALSCEQAGETWTCPLPSIPHAITDTLGFLSFDVYAPEGAQLGMSGSLTATIPTTNIADTDPSNNSRSDSFTVGAVAVVTHAASVDRTTIAVGQDFVVTASMTNHGPDTARSEGFDVRLEVPWDLGEPADQEYAQIDDADGGRIYWATGVSFSNVTLAPGQTFTAHVRYTALRPYDNADVRSTPHSGLTFSPVEARCERTGLDCPGDPVIAVRLVAVPPSQTAPPAAVRPHGVRNSATPASASAATASVAAVATASTSSATTAGLAYTGASIRGQLLYSLLLILGGAAMIVISSVTRRPRSKHR